MFCFNFGIAGDNVSVKQSGDIRHECHRRPTVVISTPKSQCFVDTSGKTRGGDLIKRQSEPSAKQNKVSTSDRHLVQLNSSSDSYPPSSSSSSTNSSYNSIPPQLAVSQINHQTVNRKGILRELFINIPKLKRSISFNEKGAVPQPVPLHKIERMTSVNCTSPPTTTTTTATNNIDITSKDNGILIGFLIGFLCEPISF